MESPRAMIFTVDWRFDNSVGNADVATGMDAIASNAERIVIRMFANVCTFGGLASRAQFLAYGPVFM